MRAAVVASMPSFSEASIRSVFSRVATSSTTVTITPMASAVTVVADRTIRRRTLPTVRSRPLNGACSRHHER